MSALKFRPLLALAALGACSVLNSYDEVVETPAGSGGGSAGKGGGSSGGSTSTAGAGAEAGDTGTGGGEGGAGAATPVGGAAGAAGGGPLTYDQFMMAFVPAYCERVLYCENKLGFGALLEIICHPSIGDEMFAQLGATERLAAGFDPEQGQQCLDSITLLDCSVYNTLGERDCDFVFSPTEEVDSTCSSDADCRDGWCEFTDVACGGICRPLPGENEDCSERDCATGYYCDSMNACQPVGDAGADCTTSEACNPTLWCNTNTQKCEALPDVGDFCQGDLSGDPCRGSLVCGMPVGATDEECVTGGEEGDPCSSDLPCEPGMRCSDTLDECVPLSPPGGPCESSENCPALFECVAEECVPRPSIGGDCDAILTCIRGECVNGTCEAFANGEECSGGGIFDTGCAGYCDQTLGQCADRKADGSTCEDDWECEEGSACRGPEGSEECQSCP